MRTSELHRCMPYNGFPPHTHSNQFLEIWVLSRSSFDVTRLLCKICCQFGQDLELREKKRLWDNPCLRSGLESFSSKLCHHGRFLLSTVPTKPLSFLSRAGGGGEDDDDDEDLLLNYLNRELDDFQPFRCSDLVSKYLEVLNQIFRAGSKFCTSSQRIWLPAAADEIFQKSKSPHLSKFQHFIWTISKYEPLISLRVSFPHFDIKNLAEFKVTWGVLFKWKW